MQDRGLFVFFLKIRTVPFLCAMVMVASLLNWTSAAVASPLSCLTHDRATRTWAGKELSKDADGCWTFWRKGLPHLFNDPPPLIPKIRAADDTSLPQPEKLWLERWPDMVVVEAPRPPAYVEPDQPLVTRHTVAIIIIVIVMILAIIETLTGKIITRRFMK